MAEERDSESTLRLIDRARADDADAVQRLFERHLAPLRRWASGRLPAWARDLADIDDLVQDTLLQTFKRMDTFEPRGTGALFAYLRQAVLNRIRDELRRKGRQPEVSGFDDLEPDPAPSPLDLAIGKEAVERCERALHRLMLEEQEAIVARIEIGCSYQGLAEVLGKPTAEAARKAAQRVLVRLAEEMKHDRGDLVSYTNSPVALAIIHSALGNRDGAFAALERIAAVQPHHVGRTLNLPELTTLEEPRLAASRERFGLLARREGQPDPIQR